jgi:hypothetical protein
MMMVSSTSWALSQYMCTQPASRTVMASCCPPHTLCGLSPSRVTIEVTIGRRIPAVRQ